MEIERNGFLFKRTNPGQYTMQFSLQNDQIDLLKVIDFPLIQLIFDLNKDIFEFIQIERKNDQEAVVVLLGKHILEDIGFPQRYAHVCIVKVVDPHGITFRIGSISTQRPESIPIEAEPLVINDWTCQCFLSSVSGIQFHVDMEDLFLLPMVERIVGLLSFKIFERVKQFIENVQM
jgi:hypothetical protein